MKSNKIMLLSSALLLAAVTFGQEYREGELIVKLKPTSRSMMKAAPRGVVSGVGSMDAVLNSIHATSARELTASQDAGSLAGRKVRTYAGSTMTIPDASKIYQVSFDASQTSVMNAVRQMETLADVEYAEPNYIVRISENADKDYDDPFYPEQNYLHVVGVPSLWTSPVVSSKRPVIAILDTGVDITHPDLAGNIYTNEKELYGNLYDDDGNGFDNDIHGWDFVGNSPNIRDNNGHGTHCAGIAAAVGGNGIGIAGANPDALILPVTVLQSNGQGDVATIIRGIEYAVANGADVINMSFGLYATSKAFEQTLANAYLRCVLVAAAGNDCLPLNGMCPACHKVGKPMFPAAYTFVLGVQAKDALGVFSNYDPDGPISTVFDKEKLYNYELTAPGMNILSTYPNGKYRTLSGTSMAAPLMAGAISRLLQSKDLDIHEELLGDLIYSAPLNIGKEILEYTDVWKTYQIREADRHPSLSIVECRIDDGFDLLANPKGNGNGQCNAGETIALYPVIKNVWGNATNVRVSIERMEGVEEGAATLLNNETMFPSISSYATEVAREPIRIKVSEKCDDELYIPFRLTVTCDNQTEPLEHEFMLKVYNRVDFYGTLYRDTVLYPGTNYYAPHPIRIPKGITMTIMPGTHIVFGDNSGIMSEGNIVCQGTAEQHIIFESENKSTISESLGLSRKGFSLNPFGGEGLFEYTDFSGFPMNEMSPPSDVRIWFRKCTFSDCVGKGELPLVPYYDNCNIWEYCNFVNCYNLCVHGCGRNNTFAGNGYGPCFPVIGGEESGDNFAGNIIDMHGVWPASEAMRNMNGREVSAQVDEKYGEFVMHIGPCYYGSANTGTVRSGILDFSNPLMSVGTITVDISNMLTRPNPEAPGCVWKVLVDGIDAQDERELLEPLGFGEHRVEVYFSKPMNKAYVPNVGMGLEAPYDQLPVNQRGQWNEEGDVYTVYMNLDAKSQSDGINTISVRGARDCENFICGDECIRFKVEVQLAQAMSTNLAAEAGPGSIRLTWETDEEDFADLMGYTVMRQEVWDEPRRVWVSDEYGGHAEMRDRSDLIQVNAELLPAASVEYIDYDVTPGVRYAYVIKEMGTDFQQFDISNETQAVPLFSIPGDANGDGQVNVVDVVSEVLYISGEPQKPFVFDSADLNKDGRLNILDVILTVNIIMNPAAQATASISACAQWYVEEDVLWIDSPADIAGLQIMTGRKGEGARWLAQDGMECHSAGECHLCYSMTGRTLPAGRHAVLRLDGADVSDVVAADRTGRQIMMSHGDATGMTEVSPERDDSSVVYDITGRRIATKSAVKGIYIMNSKKHIR